MKGITCCAECAYYWMKTHKCSRGANKEPDLQNGDDVRFFADCPLDDVIIKEKRLLVWLEDYKQLKADYADLDSRLRTANTEIDRLQSVSSWIPCIARLPKVGEPVLIYDPYNEEMVVASLDCDKIGFSNDDCWYGLRNVPFWMYLPNKPVSADNPCGGDDNAKNFNSQN